MLDNIIVKKFLKQLENLHYGTVSVTLMDGKKYDFVGNIDPEPKADFIIHHNRVITNLVAKGDIGFTESYRDGDFETSNLSNLLIIALKNEAVLDEYIYGGFFANMMAQIFYYLKRNSIRGSKRNIHAHYDLGNSFYELWLDPTMSYSSALFQGNPLSLEQGQQQKYDRIIEQLGRSSGSLLEVGCGWGGFAERAIEKGDYAIKGITISQNQFDYAHQRVGDKAAIVLEDYRIQTGRYDNIVSIEMFEAVGEKYWPTYFSKLQSLLADKGKAIVQTITIKDQYFDKYRQTGDMLRSFIFPGGMLPSVPRFEQEANQAGLKMINHYEFGQCYARTLKIWLDRFDELIDKVKQLGFDQKFINIWRFYLSACIASFTVGRTNVMQAELCHA